jgi:hypothetical protein
MSVEIKWAHGSAAGLVKAGFGRPTQLFAASEYKRLMEPYVPANNLILARSARVSATETSGEVEYNVPYAHYQYEGELYVDPITGKGAFTNGERFWSRPGVAKVPSGRKLHYNTAKHPLATDHWDKAAAVAEGDTMTREIEAFIGRRLND